MKLLTIRKNNCYIFVIDFLIQIYQFFGLLNSFKIILYGNKNCNVKYFDFVRKVSFPYGIFIIWFIRIPRVRAEV